MSRVEDVKACCTFAIVTESMIVTEFDCVVEALQRFYYFRKVKQESGSKMQNYRKRWRDSKRRR